jgi:hypothetical protein
MNVREQRNAYFGRIFGYMSVVTAGRLTAEDEFVGQVVTQLVDLGRKKSYLTELCSEALYKIVADVSMDTLTGTVTDFLRDKVGSTVVDPIVLTAWLAMEERGVDVSTMLPEALTNGKLADPQNFAELAGEIFHQISLDFTLYFHSGTLPVAVLSQGENSDLPPSPRGCSIPKKSSEIDHF